MKAQKKGPPSQGRDTAGENQIARTIIPTNPADGNLFATLLTRLIAAIADRKAAHVKLYTRSLCRLLGRWAAR